MLINVLFSAVSREALDAENASAFETALLCYRSLGVLLRCRFLRVFLGLVFRRSGEPDSEFASCV